MSSADLQKNDVGAIVQRVTDLIADRNIFRAIDLARTAIADYRGRGEPPFLLRLLEVEALQMIRAASAADLRFTQLGLNAELSSDSDLRDRRDLLAARIKRDAALRLHRADASRELRGAARAFEELFHTQAKVTLLASAATCYAYARDLENARRCADGVLRILNRIEAVNPDAMDTATLASIKMSATAIFLEKDGDQTAAIDALQTLVRLWESTPQRRGHEHDRARVLRRLRLICDATEADTTFLEKARDLKVVHYIAHPFDPSLNPKEIARVEADLQREIDVLFDGLSDRPVSAFGSLSAGGEIMMAETLLDRGAELHVQIPCLQEHFIEKMVAPMGGDWVVRYYECLKRSKYGRADVTNPCTSAASRIGRDIELTAQVAMGRAILQSARLETNATQIAILPDQPATPWGPHDAMAYWKGASLGRSRELPMRAPPLKFQDNEIKEMEPVAILFSDISGFSRLSNEDLQVYSEEFLAVLSRAFRQANDGDVLHLNTWGDALFAVFESVEKAADSALALRSAAAEFCASRSGPLSEIKMRIALHHGPALKAEDSLTGKTNFFGAAITLGARVEPVSTPGAVMMTEAFAARLALSRDSRWMIDFVGETRLPKNYGETSLYLLSDQKFVPALPDKPA